MTNFNRGETNKYWEDPNAYPENKLLASQISGLGIQIFEQPDYKKEPLFRASKVQRSLLTLKE